MEFRPVYLILIFSAVIGVTNGGRFISTEWYKPAYNEVYAYKGPQKTPQQTLEDMKNLSDVFEKGEKTSSVKFMKNEIDQLIKINEWPAKCDKGSVAKVEKFIRSELSWQLYIVPYLQYQMGRMCDDNKEYREAKQQLDQVVEKIDKNDDKELSALRQAIEKNNSKTDHYILAPLFEMRANVFRGGVVDYMKGKFNIDKKITREEFKELFEKSVVRMCKKYVETTSIGPENMINALPSFNFDTIDNIYPGLHDMLFKRRACAYATVTHFDLAGEIYDLLENPKLMNKKKSLIPFRIKFGKDHDDDDE